MPARSTAFKNQVLAGQFGPNRGASAPDSYVVRLWQDPPSGVSPSEADWGGYTPVEWSSDDWLTPDGAAVDADGVTDFGAPTSAGTDAARYWALHDADTDELCYDAPLERPINVVGTEPGPVQIRMTVPYASN